MAVLLPHPLAHSFTHPFARRHGAYLTTPLSPQTGAYLSMCMIATWRNVCVLCACIMRALHVLCTCYVLVMCVLCTYYARAIWGLWIWYVRAILLYQTALPKKPELKSRWNNIAIIHKCIKIILQSLQDPGGSWGGLRGIFVASWKLSGETLENLVYVDSRDRRSRLKQ